MGDEIDIGGGIRLACDDVGRGRRRPGLAAHQPADMHLFERSGHCPMWEEPERWNRVVGDWIAAR